MAEVLSRSADYRILRRLVARPAYVPTPEQDVRTGVLLDTETTGLDHAKDEIIELGMVKFDYTADGRIVGLRDTFSAFNEPSAPVSAEVTALTGITAEMVAGHKFNEAAVTAFVDDAVIIIAHKAASTENSSSATGPYSSTRPGPAPRPRSTGALTALQARSSDIC